MNFRNIVAHLRNSCVLRNYSSSSVGTKQTTSDIVIIGGGVVGSSTAYFLSSKSPNSKITVIEKDSTYKFSATTRSASSIRHQFSTKENIEISKFGTEFIRNAGSLLSTDPNEKVDVQFKEYGYLFLASDAGKGTLENNTNLQRSLNCDVTLLQKEELGRRFPWLNIDDLAAGSFGESGEGWFDPSLFLGYLKQKAIQQGVTYTKGAVENVILNDNKSKVQTVVVNVDGKGTEEISCGHCVNTSGTFGANISRMIGYDIPVRPRKRCIFLFSCAEPEKVPKCPLVVDPTGLYFRAEGKHFITGIQPLDDPDVDLKDFDVDYDLFDDVIWPGLAHRVPVFECARLESAWAGHYDFNTFDHNVIVGPHPVVNNFYYANGFSGHGLQQSPAIGRALSELILAGKFETLDLSNLSYERIASNQPIVELNVV